MLLYFISNKKKRETNSYRNRTSNSKVDYSGNGYGNDGGYEATLTTLPSSSSSRSSDNSEATPSALAGNGYGNINGNGHGIGRSITDYKEAEATTATAEEAEAPWHPSTSSRTDPAQIATSTTKLSKQSKLSKGKNTTATRDS